MALVLSMIDDVQVRNPHVRAVRRAIKRTRPELDVEAISMSMRALDSDNWEGWNDTFETQVQTKAQYADSLSNELVRKIAKKLVAHPAGQIKLLVIHAPSLGEIEGNGDWLFPFGPTKDQGFEDVVQQRLNKLRAEIAREQTEKITKEIRERYVSQQIALHSIDQETYLEEELAVARLMNPSDRIAPDLRVVILGAVHLSGRPKVIQAKFANMLQLIGAPRGSVAGLSDSEFEYVPTSFAGPTVYERFKYPLSLLIGGASYLIARRMGVVTDPSLAGVIVPAMAVAALAIDELVHFIPRWFAKLRRERFGPRVVGRQFSMSQNYEVRTEDAASFKIRGSSFVVGENDAALFGCEKALGAMPESPDPVQIVPRVRVRVQKRGVPHRSYPVTAAAH